MDSEAPEYGLLAEGDAKLDAQGTWHTQQELKVDGQATPHNVRFESSVTDVSRKTISGSIQTLLHPADFYLGLQHLEDWFVPAPSSFQPRVVAFSPQGQRVTGKAVELELTRRRWASVREVWEGGYRQVYKQLGRLGCQVHAQNRGYRTNVRFAADGRRQLYRSCQEHG